ncbi:hypothetical protein G9A89_012587 [Geosiphon pyriformis]|nr:hypothetical protein G9A89_012587 [Geosiphon pyriformis]
MSSSNGKNLAKIFVGDLFCGCGGLSLGAKQAGFSLKWAIDIDHNACLTYKHNHPESFVFEEPIENFLNRLDDQWFNVEVLLAAPPCQGFSNANTRGTREGRKEKNMLLFNVSDAVRILRPKILLMENVVGFHSRKESQGLTAEFYSRLTNMEYTFETTILSSANFGAPQKRKRFFLLAAFQGQPIPRWPKVTHFVWEDLKPNEREEWLSKGYCETPTVREAFQGLPVTIDTLNRARRHISSTGPQRISQIPNVEDFNQNSPDYFMRLEYNKIASTVLASPNPGWKCIHPSVWRWITVRECARLQGFPDSFEILSENQSVPSKYRQAKAILLEIMKSLLQLNNKNRVTGKRAGAFKWLYKRIIDQAADKTWSQKAVNAFKDFELKSTNPQKKMQKRKYFNCSFELSKIASIFKEIKTKFIPHTLSNNDNLRFIHMSEAARNSIKECKTLLKKCHCAVKNDDGNDVKVLAPLLLPFFADDELIECALLLNANENSSRKKTQLHVAELKPVTHRANRGLWSDLVKLGNELKDMVDSMVDDYLD